ncbi:MAG: hypothetical protein CXT73_05750 [Methanobacteriota archaeon]|jgi:phosphoribosylformylglycinamidine (FGAM) synthase PurS component|nr:MAG: hypothetical protein CXT73_05750 [Euryarchaeota archaeon]
MKKFKITTKLREGIKDIEGETISTTLNASGWHIENMKVGQVFYFDAPHHKINELCEQVLVNTLLYDYKVENVND